MRVLAVGDVVGKNGTDFLKLNLGRIKQEYKIDMAIVNGENSAEGNGILPDSARGIFSAGANIITTGNHAFRRKEIFSFFNENTRIIRPYNFPSKETPGRGFCTIDVNNIKVCVINLMGSIYLENLDNPFKCVDEIIKMNKDCLIKIIDFHAEATAEKLALGYYVDGRVSAVFGTHTHVQTSDEQIFSRGTGYITDVGMTGPINSVLGVKKELSIRRIKDKLPVRFQNADGPCKMESVIFDINEKSGKTVDVIRLRTS